MKFMVIACSLAAGALSAEPLTQGERDRALSELHATRKRFLDAIANVSAAQWTFKASPEKWSIAQVAEHIAISDEFVFGVTQQVLKSPAAPGKADKKNDEKILVASADRSQKFQAPEPIQPTSRFKSKEELTAFFKNRRDATIDYVEKTPDSLRDHVSAHPVFKDLDAYQWILLIAGHSERHVRQIEEVKAAAGYPAPTRGK